MTNREKKSMMPEEMCKARRVLIVDDHPLVRQGLAAMINRQPDLEVCGEAGSATEALECREALQPDLMVIDIMLQGVNGLELIKNIHALDPALPMVVLSMHDETLYAERALRAGASGYVMKQEPVERVLEVIRKALDGQIGVSPRISNQLLRSLAGSSRQEGLDRTGVASLSDRELEVFELIGRGLSTQEIADRLHLGFKTVETHRGAVKGKLKIRTAMELIQRATLWVAGSGGEPLK